MCFSFISYGIFQQLDVSTVTNVYPKNGIVISTKVIVKFYIVFKNVLKQIGIITYYFPNKIALMRLMSWIVNMLMKAKPDNQQLETHEHSHSLTRKTQLYKQGNCIFIIINSCNFSFIKKHEIFR